MSTIRPAMLTKARPREWSQDANIRNYLDIIERILKQFGDSIGSDQGSLPEPEDIGGAAVFHRIVEVEKSFESLTTETPPSLSAQLDDLARRIKDLEASGRTIDLTPLENRIRDIEALL